MLELISSEDPLLHRRVKEGDLPRAELMNVVQEMVGTMLIHDGVGLAANQVGLDQRIIVVREVPTDVVTVMLNPEIIKKSTSEKVRNEGCLSYPGVVLPVPRSVNISVKYESPGGGSMTRKLSEYVARIVQHEVDHLDGITFLDRNKEYEKIRAHRNR